MWKPINGKTPKKEIIWLGGEFKGKWCTCLTTRLDDVYPKWVSHWHYCYIPDDPESY